MTLRRTYRGIEGYFYRVGGQRLVPCGATVERAFYGHLGNSEDFVNTGILNLNEFGLYLLVNKDNGAHTTFTVRDIRDIACVLIDFQVCSVDEIKRLSLPKRRVTVYSSEGVNYGIKIGEGD
jgi:hypothetical protein